ncbi:protein TIFY 6a-like isoform X2 [Triticum dicoccoides]|uniref:protein TIFY 6a-like isoform X2 n=1 Tax=Triticum dicoccoides TaxID=85692 RepID=UPI00188EFDBB|nr:protein TIFY 6a-like isoform X2 [Triticum dicoccoides]
MSMEIGSNDREEEEEDTGNGNPMKPGTLLHSAYPPPPGLLRRGAPVTHRRQSQQAIPAPFMSSGPPTADTPMPHHQGQLGMFHGQHGGSRPLFCPPGSYPSAADAIASRNQQRFTANSAVYAPSRRIWNPNSTLMTMFYNGAVNVFDVPVDKAREIMVLASRTSVSDNAARVPVPEPRHVSVISSPIPTVSQAPTISKRIPGYQNYTPAPTTSSGVPSSVVPPPSQASSAQRMQQASPAVAAAIKPIAVHQSRKASLARFLEKRKERVSSVTPYPLSKSPLVSSGTFGSASTPSRLSSADNAPPSNNCQESMSKDMYNGASLGWLLSWNER